jgi:hypothetical protein
MRTLFGSFASLLVMLVIGCNTVDPDECWPNTSGGFGGSGAIPIGAGVGATTTGGDFISPPRDPLTADSTYNPCVAPGAFTHAEFDLSEFPFVTTVKDDGTGPAGGYQEAKVKLEFSYLKIPHPIVMWYCPFTIKMPLRTESMGKVSANRAAKLSKEVTEAAANAKTMDFSLPQGVFCSQYRKQVDATFKAKYPGLGATTTIP